MVGMRTLIPTSSQEATKGMIANLDLELLRTFVAIVERESFAAAAESVHRSQPAITQQMHRLETQLDKTLFKKSGRSKHLTDDGLRLLIYARRLLALNDEACMSMSGSALIGEVRIGAPVDIADSILPNLLKHFATTFPSLRMTVNAGQSSSLVQAMKRGEIDMTVSLRDDLEHRRIVLRTSPAVWICASDFKYDRSQPLPLILSDEPSIFRRIALAHLERANVPWRISYGSPTLPGITAAVRAGLGVTARSVEILNPDYRVLGVADGLPRLPDVTYYLYLGSGSNANARRLFDSIVT